MRIFTLLILIMAFIASTVVAQEDVDDTPESESAKEQPEGDAKAKKPAAASKIYTWVDEKGNRIYSDVPREGAKELKIQKSTDYSPPEVKSPWPEKPKDEPKKIAYTQFSIVSPINDATIRSNQGSVQVAFDIRPKLMAGDQIVLMNNGAEVKRSRSPVISLMNINRGSHTLSGKIINRSGQVKATSDSVTIHLHRPTIRRGS